MQYEHIVVPPNGHKITINTDLSLHVPDKPIIPYIEGDGIGIDVTPAMLRRPSLFREVEEVDQGDRDPASLNSSLIERQIFNGCRGA